MKFFLLALLLCATSFGQVTTISANSTTGFDITSSSNYYNYTLYRGNPSLWGDLGRNGYVDYTVSASAAGTYALQLYYANGTQANGSATLLVNGQTQSTASIASTVNWAAFQLSAPASVTLPAGTSTIRIAAASNFQAFNLAGMLVSPLSVSANTVSAPTNTLANPLSGMKFYVNPYSEGAQNVGQSCSNGASISKIANQPQGVWFGDWNTNPQADAATVMKAAAAQGTVPIIVAYNIVNRDCGGFSSGGAANSAAYQAWIQGLSLGIGNAKAVVIFEPDALMQLSTLGCLTGAQQSERLSLFQYAISMFQQHAPNASVYYDAGNSNGLLPAIMAQNLLYAGVGNAAGFALNVSNYETTANNTAYGQQISALAGNKHFVIDTSRNGQGPTWDHQWCNPLNRGLGSPSQGFSSGLVDGYLWVQNPGSSDGYCNGGPAAGSFSNSIACTLSANAIF